MNKRYELVFDRKGNAEKKYRKRWSTLLVVRQM